MLQQGVVGSRSDDGRLLHILILKVGISLLEVSKRYHAVRVRVYELQRILRHPALAEVLTVHHLEQTVKVLRMSVEVVEVKNLVKRSTVPLYYHVKETLLVLAYSLWHAGLQCPSGEEVLIVYASHLLRIAVEHTVDDGRYELHGLFVILVGNRSLFFLFLYSLR